MAMQPTALQQVVGGPSRVKTAKASDYSPMRKMGALDKSRNTDLLVEMTNFFWEQGTGAADYQTFAHQYDESWLMYRGHQYLTDELEDVAGDDMVRVNRDICFRTVRRINPLLTDARPVRYIKSDQPDELAERMQIQQAFGLSGADSPKVLTNADIAHDMEEFWHAMERRQQAEADLAVGLTNMTVGGMAWAFPFWDVRNPGDPGIGRVTWLRDSKAVVLDDDMQRHDLADARFCLIEKFYDADILQREARLSNAVVTEIMEEQYPDYGGLLQQVGDARVPMSRIMSNPENRKMLFRPKIRVVECWYWAQLPIERLLDGDTKAVENPAGRVWSVAGKHLISAPRPNPYWHGMFPGVPFRDNPDAKTNYGLGEIHWLKHDQIALNEIINQMLYNVLLMSDAGLLVEDGALKTHPETGPGRILEVNMGRMDGVQPMKVEPISGGQIQLLSLFDGHAKERVNETMEGLPPGAQSSGVAINSLQDAAFTIIREKTRQLEWGYHRLGVMEVHNIQQFASQALVNEMVGEGPKDLGEFMRWHPKMQELYFSISVESKADLPMNVMDRLKLALQLAGQGHIDSTEVLEYARYPRSRRLEEEMSLADDMERESAEVQLMQFQMAKQQLMTQMAQMQAQMQGMGGGMPGAPAQGGGQGTPSGGAAEVGISQATGVPAQNDVVERSQPPA